MSPGGGRAGHARDRPRDRDERRRAAPRRGVDVHAADPGRGPQAGRRVHPEQATADERDAVAQAVGLVEVVGGEDDRPARPPEAFDRLADDERRLRIEGRGRLVEEDDAGSWSRARAIASFCFMPLLNVPAMSSRRSHSENRRR